MLVAYTLVETRYLGNIPDVDPSFLARSLWHLADVYGPIFRLNLVDRQMIVVSNYELANEVMNDDNYEKTVKGVLEQVGKVAGDGSVHS